MLDDLGLTPFQERLLVTAAIMAGLLLLRRAVFMGVRRRIQAPLDRYRWQKGISYTTVLVGAIVLWRIWFVSLGSVATFLGLVTAGLAIALKDPVTNLAGWLFILLRRPFEVSDRVQIGDHAGDVVDLRLFQFTLLEMGQWVAADQPTGRLVHVPNGWIFTQSVANYTRGFRHIWIEVPVQVTFESDWQSAREALLAIATRHGEPAAEDAAAQLASASWRFALGMPSARPSVYVSVAESGVVLTIRIPCDPRRRRDTTDLIWRDVLEAIAGLPSVDLAYPTTRFFDHAAEGKPRLRPD